MSPELDAKITADMKAALDAMQAHAAERYVRERDLPKLLPEIPDEAGIIPALERELEVQRSRGKAGHRSYNLTRHVALRTAFDGETLMARRA